MVKKVKSAGGLVYIRDKERNEPNFLLIKRHALSKKIERVAPKGKIQKGEKPEQAALREISEETGLEGENLLIKDVLDTLTLQLYNDEGKLGVDKDITYYLVEYTGDPKSVELIEGEGYIGIHRRVGIERVL